MTTRLGLEGYPRAGISSDVVPSLVVDADSFFAPTAAPGAVTALPSLVTDADSFFAPTVASGYTLTVALFSDADSFYTPTVIPGAVTAVSPLVTDADSFYAPSVVAFGSLSPGVVSDADNVYAPTAVPGAVMLTPSLVASDDAIYAPTESSSKPLTASLVSDADSIHAPATLSYVPLLPSLVADADTLPATTASHDTTLLPSLVVDDVVFHLPTDASFYFASPNYVVDADALYAPSVAGGVVAIHPSRVVDSDVFLTAFVNKQKKGGQGGGSGGGTVTTDLKYASQIVLADSGLIYALEVEASTAKVINTRMVIYDDSGNLPGALLGQSAIKTSVVVGANNYPLLVPVSRLAGQKVWIALHSDGNFNWFLVSSPGGAKYNTDLFADGPSDPFGPTSNDNKKAPVFVLYLAAANAGMTAGLVTDDDAFYAPSISGSKTLTAPFLDDTDFFYTPSTLPTATDSPSLVPDDDVIYAASVDRAALLPGLVASDDVFYGPFFGVNSPNFDVFGASFPSDDNVYLMVVTLLGAGLPPSLVVDADAFYLPSVVDTYPLADGAHSDADAFYAPTLSLGSVSLLPPTPTSGEDFYSPVISQLLGTATMLAQLVEDEDTFYSATRVGHKSGRRQIFIRGRNDADRALVGAGEEE
jgi:hypothetical protein